MNKKRGYRRVWCVLMAVIMVCASLYFGSVEASAAIQPVKIKVTYGQTEARSMLASINAFRTSETEAWCWNETDSEKVACQTTELQYDYELERIAMQRAAEIALSFSHTRPNGSDCFTAYTSSYSTKGENIAAGQNSAAEVFTSWQETNMPYSGQGHRRNMLNATVKAVGIGHVVYQGCHYWVQEFGDKVVDATPAAANDTTQIVDVDVAPSYITDVKTNLDDVTLTVGEKATAVDFSLALNIRDYWGYQSECVIENTCAARIEDETIASLSDDLIITGLKAGTTKIWVSNPFGEEFYRTITVTKAASSVDHIVISAIPDQTYTGKEITPAVTVKDGTKTLKKDVDYTVAYSNNIKVGTATVTITGKGEYTGIATKTFQIVEETEVTVDAIADQTYAGCALMPIVVVKDGSKVLKKNVDYTVLYSNNVNVGTATVKISGRGTYEGSYSTTFKIVPRAISSVTVSKISDRRYTGKAIEPTLSISYGGKSLKKGTDYTVAFKDNINIGTATVTLTGKGNFEGTKTVTFKILGEADVSVDAIADQTYTGSALKPAVVVRDGSTVLKNNTDYTVAYSNNVNAGTATVKIKGKGIYEGSYTTSFKILPCSITKTTVSKISDRTYTGKAIVPTVSVTYKTKTLKKGTDYTVAYSNNINAGTATVTITGQGNFSGTKTVTFNIKAKESMKILPISDRSYTGKAITPTVTVKDGTTLLKQDRDYILSYSNNINAGTAKVTITGIGAYQGTATTTFRITPRLIRYANVTAIPTQKYTGSEVKPRLEITDNEKTLILVENKDFTVTYSNNVNAGTAKVKVKGIGNYYGERIESYTISGTSQPGIEDPTPETEEEIDDEEAYDEEVVHTTKIGLNKLKVTLKVGKTFRLKATVDKGSVDKITYKSSNKKIATVSSTGKIKAKKAGKVTITVKSGNVKKKCKITVKKNN